MDKCEVCKNSYHHVPLRGNDDAAICDACWNRTPPEKVTAGNNKTPQEMAANYAYIARCQDDSSQVYGRVGLEDSYLAGYAEGLAEGKRLGLEEAALCAHWKRRAIEACEHVPGDVKALAAKTVCTEIEISIRALLPKDAPSAGERKDG